MKPRPSVTEVETHLRGREESISHHLEAIQDEVESTSLSIRDMLKLNPWKAVGGAAVAGLAVGFLFSGSSRLERAHTDLVEKYLEAIRTDVRHAVAQGREAAPAVEDAMQNRVPMVVYAGGESQKSGFIGSAFTLLMRILFGMAVREGLKRAVPDGAMSKMFSGDSHSGASGFAAREADPSPEPAA